MKVWRLRNVWDTISPGVYRQILAFDDNIMLMVVRIMPGSIVPKHNHRNVQAGLVVKGKLLFKTDRGELEVSEGESYYIEPMENHEVHNITSEEAVALDVFTPKREDYSAYTRLPDTTF